MEKSTEGEMALKRVAFDLECSWASEAARSSRRVRDCFTSGLTEGVRGRKGEGKRVLRLLSKLKEIMIASVWSNDTRIYIHVHVIRCP